MDTQLLKFWRPEGRGYLRSPIPCRPVPGHRTGAHPLDYVQFRANGSHHRVAADLLIEAVVGAFLGFEGGPFQFRPSLHPQAAEPGIVRPPGSASVDIVGVKERGFS